MFEHKSSDKKKHTHTQTDTGGKKERKKTPRTHYINPKCKKKKVNNWRKREKNDEEAEGM